MRMKLYIALLLQFAL